MPLLQPCTALWGGADISEADPPVAVIRDGLYLPYRSGERWGVFDRDGRIVPIATDFRDGREPSHAQRVHPQAPAGRISNRVPLGRLIYGGYINTHFGHFLINSLPRLWAVGRLSTPGTRILCHAASAPADWFSVPFIGTILAAIGLTPRDFVVLQEPVRLPGLIVPGTALREQSAGHRVYARFCRAIAERIAPGHGRPREARPVYYSKARLRGAVGLIANELEIEAVMREAGIDVVYPEQMPLAEQIRLMSERDCLIGTSGSFFHTSIFCPPRKIVCINYTESINSNYAIIDRLAGNAAAYHYPPALRVDAGRTGVLTTRYLPDARAVARELLDAAFARAPGGAAP